MYLSSLHFLLFSLSTLLINASPTLFSGSNQRPASIDYQIGDYQVRVGNLSPDSGNRDPAKVNQALNTISAWIPSQVRLGGSFPSEIRYSGTAAGLQFTFRAEKYRGDMNNVVVGIPVSLFLFRD